MIKVHIEEEKLIDFDYCGNGGKLLAELSSVAAMILASISVDNPSAGAVMLAIFQACVNEKLPEEIAEYLKMKEKENINED